MLDFDNAPPEEAVSNGLPLVRTPATGSLRAVVTSDDLVGTYTHFYKGRTCPHVKDGCPACKDGLPFRWHAWLSAYTAGKHLHVLFEMTAQASEVFVLYRKAHGTIRGAVFDATRPSRRPNGRLMVQVKPADLTGITLPEPPNLVACLCLIWNIELPKAPQRRLDKGMPRLNIANPQTAAEILRDHNGRP